MLITRTCMVFSHQWEPSIQYILLVLNRFLNGLCWLSHFRFCFCPKQDGVLARVLMNYWWHPWPQCQAPIPPKGKILFHRDESFFELPWNHIEILNHFIVTWIFGCMWPCPHTTRLIIEWNKNTLTAVFSLTCLEIRSRNEEAINSTQNRIYSLKVLYFLL